MDQDFNLALGARLRAARRRRGLSLTEVEKVSNREFSASAVGAYERGDRTISVPRLARLAGIYEVTIQSLIPADRDVEGPPIEATMDLDSIGDDSELVDQFLSAIHLLRRTSGHELSVRRTDLAVLSSLLASVPQGDSR